MADKIDTAREKIRQAHEVAEIGKGLAPPLIRGRIQDAEDIAEMADEGLGLFKRIRGIFSRKKK